MRLVRWWRGAVVAVGSALIAASAVAQGFPSRPIRMVVPFPPGGSADVGARLVSQHMAQSLGQPVVVENRAGAAGNLGADSVAKAPADGYTLLYGIGSIFTSNPWLYRDMRFDPMKDFVPLTLINAGGGFVLVVPTASPVGSLRELVAAAQKQPGRFNYASYGSGSAPHLVMEMLKSQSGISITHVPYKGAAPAMTAVLGAEVDAMFDTYISAAPQLRGGKLRAVAVSTATRMPTLPNVPAIAETYPGFEAEGWHGVFAPAGTPRDVVVKLDAALRAAVGSPEVGRWLQDNGLRPGNLSLDAFAAMLRDDHARWGRVVRTAGVVAE